MSQSFSKRLRTLRKAAGLTQAALGEKTGVHPVSITQYETGVCEPREERKADLIAFLERAAETPEAPKKRGRPKKAKAEPKSAKPKGKRAEYSKRTIKAKRREFYEAEVKPLVDQIEARVSVETKDPVRLGAVSRAWVEQQADAIVHARGLTLVDGPVRVVTIRRADLIDLAVTILRACGTKVG